MSNIKTKVIATMSTVALLLTNIGTLGVITASAAEVPTVAYSTHIQKQGWQDYKTDGELAGTEGKALRLEGIKIKIEGDKNLGIKYSTHIQGIGWQDYKTDDEMSGTEGQAKRLEAIKIELTGEDAGKYDIYYRVHAQHLGWLDWAKNGEEAGTSGLAYRLEAIEIKIVEKDSSAPGSTTHPYEKKVNVSYRTHVQSYGWQDYVSEGKMAGTSGKARRLEAIKIKLDDTSYGGIEYSTHIQGIGWQKFVSNDALSGTSGQGKRLEAIKIKLTGSMANKYDVYYRVHAQHFGWMGWAKNGQAAGTEGYSYRLEGIQIRLVAKGNAAPGSNSNYFSKKVKQPSGYYDAAKTQELYGYISTARSYYGVKSGELDNMLERVYNGSISTSQAESEMRGWVWNDDFLGYGSIPTTFNGLCVVKTTIPNVEGSQFTSITNNYGMYPNEYMNLKVYRNSDGTLTVSYISAGIMGC